MNPVGSSPLLGPGGTAFMGLYLLTLIAVGWIGKRARKENSLSDFYLAGRGIGISVLFLTLYATQYSGNTMIGFAGRAYREGFEALVLVPFLAAAVGAYAVYAPKLYRLSKLHAFITPGDFIQQRFNLKPLTVFASILCIIALANYILTNLKAIGYIVVASTGGVVSFTQGVILLSLVMVIYETLGGMRSVAWTDVIQGVILLIGVILIFLAIQVEYGGLNQIGEKLYILRPGDFLPLHWEGKRLWMSTLALSFFGISIYPHAIQRIFAAKDENTLKRSLQIMVFMPLITVFFMVVVGLVGATQIPYLDNPSSEQITLLMLQELAQRNPVIGVIMVLFLSAAVAAIMSTVDSALLSISSMITKDFYSRLRPGVSQAGLTLFGKTLSWVIMAITVYLAIILPQTIWRLLEIKLELLVQVAPAIFLGLHFKNIRPESVLYGMIVGTIIAVGIMVANQAGLDVPSRPCGIHAGIWGLGSNLLIVAIIESLFRRD